MTSIYIYLYLPNSHCGSCEVKQMVRMKALLWGDPQPNTPPAWSHVHVMAHVGWSPPSSHVLYVLRSGEASHVMWLHIHCSKWALSGQDGCLLALTCMWAIYVCSLCMCVWERLRERRGWLGVRERWRVVEAENVAFFAHLSLRGTASNRHWQHVTRW